MTEARDAKGRPEPLPVARVRRRCDPEQLGFETTSELEPLSGMLGQERAEEAMRFGVGTRHRGFNLYVLGPAGMGKHRLVDDVVGAHAKGAPVPDDWVYVHRFDDPDRPRAMRLPVGRGAELEEAMDRVVEELGDAIRAAFETDEFRNRRRVIEQKMEGRHEEAFSKLAEKAEEKGLKLLRTPMGFAFAPVREGEVIEPKQFKELPEDEQKDYRARLEEMEESLRALMQLVPKWQREARQELKALEREMAGYAAAQQMRDVREAFQDLEDVAQWLQQVEEDVVDNAAVFVAPEDESPEAAMQKALARSTGDAQTPYRVNLFIDRRNCEGAPIIHEDHPTLDRLIGRIEQRAQLGALVSDFTLIKPGAMHRANGGYLVLDAMRLLTSPAAWDSLKRALRRGEVEIESLGKTLGLSTGMLEPDPIPLDIKIILVGERRLYYMLSALDPDFDQLFKVAADFEDDVEWNGALAGFARLLAGIVQSEELLEADKHAVARLVEHAARLADDQKKLTTNLTDIADVLREGDWRARERGAERIERQDVQGAIEARRRRDGRLRERILERFHDDTILIATEGEYVGQINGLSVLQVGHNRFGQPNRISCRVRLGKGEVVDIEREVQLGGPLHSKGVLILSSFLGAKYASDRPLSLSASLVFEQSYGGVDGDSASCAELCALLSALADVPIQQRFAITGSVDQMGRVQAIGGVNEKIEGFFDVCAHEGGLDGNHGVIIPATNVQHLMLREDVVEAIEAGLFHLYEVRWVDEALELLTGLAAGAPDEDGVYPEDTIHGKAARRLARFAEKAKEFALAVRAGEEPRRAERVGPPAPDDDDAGGGPRD